MNLQFCHCTSCLRARHWHENSDILLLFGIVTDILTLHDLLVLLLRADGVGAGATPECLRRQCARRADVIPGPEVVDALIAVAIPGC